MSERFTTHRFVRPHQRSLERKVGGLILAIENEILDSPPLRACGSVLGTTQMSYHKLDATSDHLIEFSSRICPVLESFWTPCILGIVDSFEQMCLYHRSTTSSSALPSVGGTAQYSPDLSLQRTLDLASISGRFLSPGNAPCISVYSGESSMGIADHHDG